MIKSVLSFVFLFFISMFTLSTGVQASPGDRLKHLPVQDGGRVKPFDSFARETLELIYGRSSFKRPTNSQSEPAYLIVMSFLLSPESWVEVPLFEVNNLEIKKYLGLAAEDKHFKGNDLFKGEKFANLMQQLNDKRESKEKLNPYFQAVQRIENQFFVFKEMAAGNLLKVYPVPDKDAWLSVAESK